MTVKTRKGRRLGTVAVTLCLVLVALGLRLHRIESESVDLEEFVCIEHLDAPSLVAFIERVRSTDPPIAPLPFALVYLWTRVAGTSVVSARLIGVLLSLLMIPLTLALAAELWGGDRGRRAGLVAAQCVALSPVHVFFAQEVRHTGPLTVAVLAAAYCFVKAVHTNDKRWWALDVLANAVVVWTHLMGALFVVAQGLVLLSVGERRIRRAVPWSLAHAPVAVLTLAWLVTMPHHDSVYAFCFPPTLNQILADLLADDVVSISALGLKPSGAGMAAWRPWMDWALIAWMTIAGLWLAVRLFRAPRGPVSRRDEGTNRRAACVFLMAWWAAPVLLMALASYGGFPCHSSRYSVYSSVALYVALGGCLAGIGNRWAWRAAVAVTAVLFTGQLSLGLSGPARTDWRSAAGHIAAMGAPSEPVLIEDPFWQPIFAFNAVGLANPVAGVFSREDLADVTGFCLSDDACPGVWILAVQGFSPEPAEALGRRIQSSGALCDLVEFGGERTLFLYHCRAEMAAATPEPAAGEGMRSLAAAVNRAPGHDAVMAFDRRFKQAAGLAGAYARVGVALSRAGQVEPGARALERSVSLDPIYAVYFADLRSELDDRPDYSHVAEAFWAAFDSKPVDSGILMGVVGALFERKQASEVVRLTLDARVPQEVRAQAYSYAGMAYEELGMRDQAISAYREALTAPGDILESAYAGLAALLREVGRIEEAIGVLQSGLERYPNAAWLHAQLGLALRESGEDDAAAAELREAARLAPDDDGVARLLQDATSEAQ